MSDVERDAAVIDAGRRRRRGRVVLGVALIVGAAVAIAAPFLQPLPRAEPATFWWALAQDQVVQDGERYILDTGGRGRCGNVPSGLAWFDQAGVDACPIGEALAPIERSEWTPRAVLAACRGAVTRTPSTSPSVLVALIQRTEEASWIQALARSDPWRLLPEQLAYRNECAAQMRRFAARARWYPLAVLAEGAFLVGFAVLALVPWWRGWPTAARAVHLAALPALFVIPWALGYCPETRMALGGFQAGGVYSTIVRVLTLVLGAPDGVDLVLLQPVSMLGPDGEAHRWFQSGPSVPRVLALGALCAGVLALRRPKSRRTALALALASAAGSGLAAGALVEPLRLEWEIAELTESLGVLAPPSVVLGASVGALAFVVAFALASRPARDGEAADP